MLMITKNVKGKAYKQLIDFLSKHCNRFAFVEDRRMMDIEEERLAYLLATCSHEGFFLVDEMVWKQFSSY